MYSNTMPLPDSKPMTNGHVNNELLEHLVNNSERLSRLMSQMYGDRRRNIESECGYVETGMISAWDYQKLWDRDPVAGRVVNVFPMESWQQPPQLIEDEDPETLTDLEAAWIEVGKNVTTEGLQGWYRDDQVNSLWSYIERADIYSGISSYGAILFGIDDGRELSEPADLAANGNRKLNFIRILSECEARISSFDTDLKSARYGKPNMYSVITGLPTLNSAGEYTGYVTGVTQNQTKDVHWSRIQHVVDNPYGSEVGGIPRCQQPFNRLYDLHKMYGGSTEMYWQGAFPGISFETHPQLGGDVQIDQTAMRSQLVNYTQGLQRYLTMAGMTAKTLSPTVVDPSANIDKLIEAICILTGIPKRIFMGSERGELASTTDLKSWYNRCRHRQTSYITPFLIARFIDRLILLGVLPIPSKGYGISWPDLAAASDLEKAQIAVQRTTAMSSYVMGGLYQLIAPKDFMTRVIGYDETEANQILEDTQDNMEQMQEANLEQRTAPPEPPQQGNGNPVGNEEFDSKIHEIVWDPDEDDTVYNGGPGSGPHKGLHSLLTKHGYNHQYTEFAQGSNSKQVGSQKQPDIGHYQHSNGNTATANTWGQWRIRVASNPPKFIRGENANELKEHFKVNNTWSDEARKKALEARKRNAHPKLDEADLAWEDYGAASTIKAISRGDKLKVGDVDLNGNTISKEDITQSKEHHAALQQAAEDNKVKYDGFMGVYRAEIHEPDFDERKVFKRHSIVTLPALTAVATNKDFAEKYLDDQFAGGEDHTKVFLNFQAHPDVGITGYNLKHTGLPEAILPKGAKYKVSKVKRTGNRVDVTLYNNGKIENSISNWSDESRKKALEARKEHSHPGANKLASQVPMVESIRQPGKPKYGPGEAIRAVANLPYDRAASAARSQSQITKRNKGKVEAAPDTESKMSAANAAAYDHTMAAQYHKVASGTTNDADKVAYHKLESSKHEKKATQYTNQFKQLAEQHIKELSQPTKSEPEATPAPTHERNYDLGTVAMARSIAKKAIKFGDKQPKQHHIDTLTSTVEDMTKSLPNLSKAAAKKATSDIEAYKAKIQQYKGRVSNELVENAKFSSTQLTVTDPVAITEIKLLQDMISPLDVVELEDEPHITVRYGLHTQDAADVAKWIANAGPILIKIGRLSVFTSNPEYDVLKLEIDSNPLCNLNDRLGVLDNTNDYPEYNPHMTIAYVRKGTGLSYTNSLPEQLFGTRLLFHSLTFSNVSKERTELPLSR